MYARVTTITGASADRIEQAVAQYREQVIPWIKEQGGRGGIMLFDRESGRGLGISLWDDEESMRASEEASAQMRRDAAEQAGSTEQPSVDHYEVPVFEAS